MRVEVVSPSPAGYQTGLSYLVNDSLAIDAGAIGWIEDLERQAAIRHVLLSHTHFDHVASLPMFLENAYALRPEAVRVWASDHTERSLREHCFNGVLWPDLTVSHGDSAPFLEFVRMRADQVLELDGLSITPLELTHTAPTLGFLIDDGISACAFLSDTAPVEAVWEKLNAVPHLRTVLLECSFPNRLSELAELTRHLTPRTFAEQCSRLKPSVRKIPIHLKPAYKKEIESELLPLAIDGLELATASLPMEM